MGLNIMGQTGRGQIGHKYKGGRYNLLEIQFPKLEISILI